MCILNHVAVSVAVLAVLKQRSGVVHAGPQKHSMYLESEPKKLDSPWLVNRAVGFPSPG